VACARVFALVGGLCVFALVGWMSSLAGIPETLLSSLLKGCVSGMDSFACWCTGDAALLPTQGLR